MTCRCRCASFVTSFVIDEVDDGVYEESVLRELEEQGVLLDALAEEIWRNYDPSDT